MRDIKKRAEQGILRICNAPSSRYGITVGEMENLYELSLMGAGGVFDALITAYNAGFESGARLIENENKRRKQQGRK